MYLQLLPPPQTYRDPKTGDTYTYTGPVHNVMNSQVPMYQFGHPRGSQYWTKNDPNAGKSDLGANLNQAPRVDFNNLGTRVGPSIADIYGTGGARPPISGAGVNYGGFQRPAPRPPGFMPQFNMQQVMQNIAARRATQPMAQPGITALPMGQGLNGAPGPAGIAGLQAIAKGPTP